MKSLRRFLSSNKSSPFPRVPQPLRLPAEDQVQFDKSVKDFNNSTQIHPDVLYKQDDIFNGDTNPETGEVGGTKGKEPTRYGDWEKNGRVYDF
jgi:hypothetical protein